MLTAKSIKHCPKYLCTGVFRAFGGSADLTKQTGIAIDGTHPFGPGSISTSQTFSYSGRLIHFGIREHAMAAILNGIAHSDLIPFGSTYLVFPTT